MLYLTYFSTASERLNLNNVAEVERKESLFSLPKCSNVSKKHRTRNVRCRDRMGATSYIDGVATEWEQHRILRSAVTVKM